MKELVHCKYDKYDKKNKSWGCSVAYSDGIKDKSCHIGRLIKMNKSGCWVEKKQLT